LGVNGEVSKYVYFHLGPLYFGWCKW
jgi:hypothetical protein